MENSMALVETSPVDRKKELDEDIPFLREHWAELSAENRALVELDTGRLAFARKKLDEAMADWRKAVLAAPESDAAARARKLLARYGD
jgi:monoamine oxidase